MTKFLINYIRKTFTYGNDIGTALEELQEYDMTPHHPTLMVSTSTDVKIKEAKDEQYKIEFKAEFDGFMKRKQALESNMSKAYAFLWEQCTKGMQNKVKAHSDFKSKVKTLINSKQKKNESLQNYTKCFKTANDVLISHIGGPIELTKYMKGMTGYNSSNPDAIDNCQEKAYQQLLAFIYLNNADKAKYGSLILGLQTQQSLGNNQYPMTITEANNVLSEHKFVNTNM